MTPLGGVFDGRQASLGLAPRQVPASTTSILLTSSTITITTISSPETTTTTATSHATSTLISTTTATISPGYPSPWDSSGATAGILIACLVGGFAFGLLYAKIFAQKRKKLSGHIAGVGEVAPIQGSARNPNTGRLQASLGLGLKAFLPMPTPRNEILAALCSMGELIKHHALNQYHEDPVKTSQDDLVQALHKLGLGEDGQDIPPHRLASLALDARTRKIALRHVLSFAIFSSLDLHSSRRHASLLPSPVLEFFRMCPSPESHQGLAEETALAASQWRVLSAFLLHPDKRSRSALPPNEAVVVPQAKALVKELQGFLEPFAGRDQAANLFNVLIKSAELGYMLLSHPSDWAFVHSAGSGNGRRSTLVTIAGLRSRAHSDEGGAHESWHQEKAPTIAKL